MSKAAIRPGPIPSDHLRLADRVRLIGSMDEWCAVHDKDLTAIDPSFVKGIYNARNLRRPLARGAARQIYRSMLERGNLYRDLARDKERRERLVNACAANLWRIDESRGAVYPGLLHLPHQVAGLAAFVANALTRSPHRQKGIVSKIQSEFTRLRPHIMDRGFNEIHSGFRKYMAGRRAGRKGVPVHAYGSGKTVPVPSDQEVTTVIAYLGAFLAEAHGF